MNFAECEPFKPVTVVWMSRRVSRGFPEVTLLTTSSRMRVMNHNWSATTASLSETSQCGPNSRHDKPLPPLA